MPYTVDRPRPVPFPTGLVVKNGSKIRLMVAASIPEPESVIVSRTYGPKRKRTSGCSAAARSSRVKGSVSTTTRPPCGIASRAFSARLSRTCWSWPRSARTGPTDARRSSSSTATPKVRCRIGSKSRTTPFRSRATGWSIWRRLKASSWAVIDAERCAASRTCSTSARTAGAMSPRRSTNSEQPSTTDIILLTSWAMPPANLPTDSMRCACCSRSNECRRSVTSRCEPQARASAPCSSTPNRLFRK